MQLNCSQVATRYKDRTCPPGPENDHLHCDYTRRTFPSGSVDMSCADSIAFLRLLHKVPHPRSANPTPRALDSTLGHYVLPLETERNIASSLAFLSSLKSDSERIPALCLEENRELGRIDVLVAVNSQSGYGSQTLGEIKNGLEMIFGVVNRAIEGMETVTIRVFGGIH